MKPQIFPPSTSKSFRSLIWRRRQRQERPTYFSEWLVIAKSKAFELAEHFRAVENYEDAAELAWSFAHDFVTFFNMTDQAFLNEKQKATAQTVAH